MMTVYLILLVVFAAYLISSVKILNEHERGIILRLGRLVPSPRGPGLVLVYSPVDKLFRVKAADLASGSPITLMDGLDIRLNGDRLELV